MASRRARERQNARPWETERTGWPPGLLQDDSSKLSKWFASKPDARMLAREAAGSALDERIGDWSDGTGEGDEDEDDEPSDD